MNHDVTPIEPQMKHRQRRCPRCTVSYRLTYSILDSRRGRTVRLYQCADCGARLWEDGSTLLGEGFNDLGMFGD
jgi:DNA-directed RNA polymerase subunit RPC12/RpoP